MRFDYQTIQCRDHISGDHPSMTVVSLASGYAWYPLDEGSTLSTPSICKTYLYSCLDFKDKCCKVHRLTFYCCTFLYYFYMIMTKCYVCVQSTFCSP